MIEQVVILAGGYGTRLQKAGFDVPKPMVPISRIPMLEHQLRMFKLQKIKNFLFLTGHGHEVIENYFGDGAEFGVDIKYKKEPTPLGTGGALMHAFDMLNENFFVCYGDTFFEIDVHRMHTFHKEKNADITMFVHPNDHPFDSDLVEFDELHRVRKIHPYPHDTSVNCVNNIVNAAFYIFNRSSLQESQVSKDIVDVAKHLIPKLIEQNKKIYAYKSVEYIKDMGTPERLSKVTQHYVNRIPEKLSFVGKRVAVFLDRDGTINNEVGYITDIGQIELIDGAAKAIKLLNESGCLSVLATNQPVVARGELTEIGLQKLNAQFSHLLGHHGCYLDDYFTCIHHPDRGFKGERPELKIDCICRKPKTGMIDKAVRLHNVSRKDSWFIGDTTSDILAGKRAGLKTILVKTGYGGSDKKFDVTPDYIAQDILSAVSFLLECDK